MKREVLRDNIAKAITDAAGHGMREKCTRHADAVLDVLDSRRPSLSRVVSDADVEKVGKALYIYWDNASVRAKEAYREKVRNALESIALAQQEPVGQIDSTGLALLSDGTDALVRPAFPAMKGHMSLFASPQPAQPSVPVDDRLRSILADRKYRTDGDTTTLLDHIQHMSRADRDYAVMNEAWQKRQPPSVPVEALKKFAQEWADFDSGHGEDGFQCAQALLELIAAHDGRE